jgi:iron complex outermembrane receptor protein
MQTLHLPLHARSFTLSMALAIAPVMAAQNSRAAPSDAGDATADLNEIVVTGERREERLQDAPVAVNAFQAQALLDANVTRPGDVLRLAPNVTFVQSGQNGDFFVTIRGNTQTRLGDSSVALVIDGVQSLDQSSINQQLFDIKQIEILKGPEGALYGRNAIGGAVVITTNDPNFSAWEGNVKVGAGNGDRTSGQVSITGPIGEKFAIRGGISYVNSEGYYRNDITGEHVDRFRENDAYLRGLWHVTDSVTADFRVSSADMNGGGLNWSAILALPKSAGGTVSVFDGNNVSVPYTNDIGGFSLSTRQNASMKWDFDFGAAKLISVSSFAELKDNYGQSGYPYEYDPGEFYTLFPGNSPIGLGAQTQDLLRDSQIRAQELRLQSPDAGQFKWMVGAYYAKFRIDDISTTGADTNGVLLGLGPYPYGSPNQTLSYLNDSNDNKAYAGFANASYELGALQLSASFRYDKEDKTQTDNALSGPPVVGDPKQLPTYFIDPYRSRSAQFSAGQPKFVARYEITGDAMVYASWGRGFKTGGFNPFGTTALLRSFNPASTVGDIFPKEVADTTEIGFKTTWLDRKLSVNGAAFETLSQNAQLLEFFPQASLQAVSTADKVKMKGFELEFEGRVTENLDLIASYGYLDARVTEFAADPSYVGNPRPSTSPYTALVAAQYSHRLGASPWSMVTRVDYTRQGRTTWDWANTAGASRNPFDLINARVAVRNETWEVAAWGKNLGNDIYNAENIVLLPFASAAFRAPPRQFGADVTYKF